MLHRIGAILAFLAALWALFTSGTAVFIDVQGGAEQATGVGLGAWEVGVSLVALIIAGVTFFARSPYAGLALLIVGVIGAIFSESAVIAFMATVAVGGLMAFLGRRHAQRHHGAELPNDPSERKR